MAEHGAPRLRQAQISGQLTKRIEHWQALCPVTGPGTAEDFCIAEYPRLVGSLILFTGDADLAADLAQEALARAIRHWSRLEKMTSPGAWVHRVALNLAKRAGAKKQREQIVCERLAALQAASVQAEADSALVVRAAVLGLPERQRAAIVLRYYADLPVAEVAQIMRIAEGTVRALTHQGTEKLRLLLQPDEQSEVSHHE
jgi:RNA polymerase sigma-70 factor (ECF subfamily)